MEATIKTIERLTKTLSELQPLKPEYQQRLDKKIRLEFNYNSNHIEGNTLTYGETELLLIFDKTTGNHELREYEEMKSHDAAFELIKKWAADAERPLSEMTIKNLHEVLLVRPFWKEAQTPDGHSTRRLIEVGNYKKYPNSVRLQNGEMFHYASPEETPIQMGELVQWYRVEEEKGQFHPIELAALLHYKFVRIHPFDDGNGRVSRLLINYVLFKNNLPPIIIKSSDKKNYLFALNQADTGNIDAFVKYITEQLFWSLEISIRAARGESIEEMEDLDKKLFLLKKKLGEDPKVQLLHIYGKEAIAKVINESLIPLGFAWEEKLKNFDALFISRTMLLSVENNRVQASHFDEAFAAHLKKLGQNILSKPIKEPKLKIRCSPKGLRNIDNTISINGGEISVELLTNAYEISFTNSNHKFNRLYHQPLLEGEINTIVNTLGNFLYNIIEELTNKK